MPASIPPQPALETRNVTVSFGGFNALTDVTMTLSAGSVVGLIGPNGAGKTTLVNVLTGFQSPSSGEVLLGTEAVGAYSPFALRRLGIARTFQAGRLFAGLDVLDNLAVTGVGLGHRRRAAEDMARQVLDWIGIRHLSDQPAAGLPYTDERRVGIARALMGQPQFLLLDEPAAGMSEIEAEELSQLIARIASDLGIGVLLIEHNVGLVLGVCEHVYVLDAGQVIEQGDRTAILASQAVRDAYLGPSHEEAA
ncbi:ABC transporter ATP-binding protein [Thalassobius vesicularis]|uniref:ABC transporter ATP-binding protein n=1 Tax=Thalassobius vesicularis TaxID=1294297 RepID=A0A4S3M6K0_9RHOB|nr:ABC transporter ATP-binding protein [Thalassobius vesicularis]THD72698.1 ABC transporter ATP-binding protein [Thalassobius vesicularis]